LSIAGVMAALHFAPSGTVNAGTHLATSAGGGGGDGFTGFFAGGGGDGFTGFFAGGGGDGFTGFFAGGGGDGFFTGGGGGDRFGSGGGELTWPMLSEWRTGAGAVGRPVKSTATCAARKGGLRALKQGGGAASVCLSVCLSAEHGTPDKRTSATRKARGGPGWEGDAPS
jgi:hypothetical protein